MASRTGVSEIGMPEDVGKPEDTGKCKDTGMAEDIATPAVQPGPVEPTVAHLQQHSDGNSQQDAATQVGSATDGQWYGQALLSKLHSKVPGALLRPLAYRSSAEGEKTLEFMRGPPMEAGEPSQAMRHELVQILVAVMKDTSTACDNVSSNALLWFGKDGQPLRWSDLEIEAAAHTLLERTIHYHRFGFPVYKDLKLPQSEKKAMFGPRMEWIVDCLKQKNLNQRTNRGKKDILAQARKARSQSNSGTHDKPAQDDSHGTRISQVQESNSSPKRLKLDQRPALSSASDNTGKERINLPQVWTPLLANPHVPPPTLGIAAPGHAQQVPAGYGLETRPSKLRGAPLWLAIVSAVALAPLARQTTNPKKKAMKARNERITTGVSNTGC
ncbi:hypothetical protein BDY21DRAFT_362645 [Lineolata rhizophorae]|uniref:Uncharacterized protein n=1 Tax=Lineolata rhizophorae TaxID=578093 RepID=A0A6A6P5S4_9PEZI|nr:hypothetical protein BDY21DRAFT_362645 [Lineolata rhizophorae]